MTKQVNCNEYKVLYPRRYYLPGVLKEILLNMDNAVLKDLGLGLERF